MLLVSPGFPGNLVSFFMVPVRRPKLIRHDEIILRRSRVFVRYRERFFSCVLLGHMIVFC